MRSFAIASALCVFVASTGCGAEGEKIPDATLQALQKGEQFELFSLNPKRVTEPPENNFHGWEVLGSTTLKPAEQATIVAALKKGVAESEGLVAGCFNPRHGIRVVYEKKTYDIAICFECLSASIFVEGERESSFLLTESPQALFNKTLTAAKVKLPTEAE